jgi:hypothetical protein
MIADLCVAKVSQGMYGDMTTTQLDRETCDKSTLYTGASTVFMLSNMSISMRINLKHYISKPNPE